MSRHRKNLQLSAMLTTSVVLGAAMSPAHADPSNIQKVAREAGPIWNNDDARGRCPSACAPLSWNGQWWTTRPNQMSVCECLSPVEPVGPVGIVLPPPPVRVITPSPPLPVAIVAENGKCLDVNGGEFESRVNGGRVQLWGCHGGPNQRWQFIGGTVVAGNGKCLDVSGDQYQAGVNGARVQAWDCNGGQNQQWQQRGSTLVSPSGKCLDADGGAFANRADGAHIQLWDCHGGPNQRWTRRGAGQMVQAPPPPLYPVNQPDHAVPPVQPFPTPSGPVNRCAALTDLGGQWSRMAGWIDDHDDDGISDEEATWMKQEEKRLLQPTIDLVQAAMSENRRYRRQGGKLLNQLFELDRINDDGNYSDDSAQIHRIVRSISHLSEGCGGY